MRRGRLRPVGGPSGCSLRCFPWHPAGMTPVRAFRERPLRGKPARCAGALASRRAKEKSSRQRGPCRLAARPESDCRTQTRRNLAHCTHAAQSSTLNGVSKCAAPRLWRRAGDRPGDVMSDRGAAGTTAHLIPCRESRASRARRAESTRSTGRASRIAPASRLGFASGDIPA